MKTYHFTAERSSAPEDQVPEFICAEYSASGSFQAPNLTDAWNKVGAYCLIPGKYHATLRNGRRVLTPCDITTERRPERDQFVNLP